ncbi:MAG: glutathione S-transferase [Betaproteobacteria bacterium]|nr:glutathione S-transferase [Betaproteobacteria bacterium]
MIDLYTIRSASPNIRKASIMLHETGLPYTVKYVEKREGGKPPDDFAAISPNATVPAIQDHDTGAIIFESGAILHYLAEKTGRLLPADLKVRSEVIKWLMFEVANVGPVMGELYHYMLLEAGPRSV